MQPHQYSCYRYYDYQKLIYLDHAATTQKPIQVLRIIEEYYKIFIANVHRGAHQLSAKATEDFENGDVVRITIKDAHTYICEGLLSHNKSPRPPVRPGDKPPDVGPFPDPTLGGPPEREVPIPKERPIPIEDSKIKKIDQVNIEKNKMEIRVSCGEGGITEFLNDGWIIVKEYSEEKICTWKSFLSLIHI